MDQNREFAGKDEYRDLTARLLVAEDRLSLLNIEGAYGRAYDSKADEGRLWASLFTEDGIYQARQLPGMSTQNFAQGRENLAKFCVAEPLSGIHFMHAPFLTIDGDQATGRIHYQFQASTVDQYARTQSRWTSGYYDVLYVRTESGWLIKRRITTYLQINHQIVFPYEPTPADLFNIDRDVSYDDQR